METVNRRKRSYTAAFKLKVVEHAEKKSKNDASKVFLVDRKRVQDWCKQKEDLIDRWKKYKTTISRPGVHFSTTGKPYLNPPLVIPL